MSESFFSRKTLPSIPCPSGRLTAVAWRILYGHVKDVVVTRGLCFEYTPITLALLTRKGEDNAYHTANTFTRSLGDGIQTRHFAVYTGAHALMHRYSPRNLIVLLDGPFKGNNGQLRLKIVGFSRPGISTKRPCFLVKSKWKRIVDMQAEVDSDEHFKGERNRTRRIFQSQITFPADEVWTHFVPPAMVGIYCKRHGLQLPNFLGTKQGRQYLVFLAGLLVKYSKLNKHWGWKIQGKHYRHVFLSRWFPIRNEIMAVNLAAAFQSLYFALRTNKDLLRNVTYLVQNIYVFAYYQYAGNREQHAAWWAECGVEINTDRSTVGKRRLLSLQMTGYPDRLYCGEQLALCDFEHFPRLVEKRIGLIKDGKIVFSQKRMIQLLLDSIRHGDFHPYVMWRYSDEAEATNSGEFSAAIRRFVAQEVVSANLLKLAKRSSLNIMADAIMRQGNILLDRLYKQSPPCIRLLLEKLVIGHKEFPAQHNLLYEERYGLLIFLLVFYSKDAVETFALENFGSKSDFVMRREYRQVLKTFEKYLHGQETKLPRYGLSCAAMQKRFLLPLDRKHPVRPKKLGQPLNPPARSFCVFSDGVMDIEDMAGKGGDDAQTLCMQWVEKQAGKPVGKVGPGKGKSRILAPAHATFVFRQTGK